MTDDKRKNNGGNKNAGRKPKTDEQELIGRLQEHIQEDAVFIVLKKLIDEEDMKAITLYFNYRYGKPKETKDMRLEIDKNFPDWLDES